jgi:hypothetical protein
MAQAEILPGVTFRLKLQQLTPETVRLTESSSMDHRVYLKATAKPQAFYLPARSPQFMPAPSSCTKIVVH